MNKWLHFIGLLITGSASFTVANDIHTIVGDAVAVFAGVQALYHAVLIFYKRADAAANATTKK